MKCLYGDENLFYKMADMHFHLQLLRRGQSELQHFILPDQVYVLAEFFQVFCSVSAVPKFSRGRTPKMVLHIPRSPHMENIHRLEEVAGKECSSVTVKLLPVVSISNCWTKIPVIF